MDITQPQFDPANDPTDAPRWGGHGRSAKDVAAEKSRWGVPVDFLADQDVTPPDLQRHHVPAALWPFVTDTAARMGADPTAVFISCLVSCASVMSDDWRLQ